MSIKEHIRPVSDFRKSTAQLLKQLKTDHQPIILTQRGRSVAVIVDVDTYERLDYDQKFKASINRGLKDLEQGRVYSHQHVMKELDQVLKKYR